LRCGRQLPLGRRQFAAARRWLVAFSTLVGQIGPIPLTLVGRTSVEVEKIINFGD
jgi:hypothetical protein